MDTRRLQARWIGAAALTVLSSAAVAALTLTTTGTTTALPAAAAMVAQPSDTDPLSAATTTPPAPVTLTVPVRTAPTAPGEVLAPKAAPPQVVAVRPVDPRCTGAGWQERRGAETVERLRRPADARAVPVAFRSARPDVLGMADLDARRVDVYVRSCATQSDALLLHVVAHELGHLVDAIGMDDDLRTRWMAARGIPAGTPWFGCSRCSDFATPAGDFAETYAQWQRGASTNRSQLAPAPSRAQLASLAATFFSPL